MTTIEAEALVGLVADDIAAFHRVVEALSPIRR